MHSSLRLLTALIAALALAACNDSSSGDDSSGSAGASPSLGLITNAAVNFYEADGTTLIGSAETGDDGSVDIQTGSYDGPVVVEVLGDDTDAMYYDEASATLVPFPDGSAIHAIVPGPGTVGVTPLTEIAWLAAQRQGLFPISAQAVDELNEIVRAALAPGLSSILSVPTLVGDPGVTSLGDDEAGNYALLLAALAELGSGQAAPALAVLEALAADLADGDIDGEDNGTDIGAPYADFLAEMQTALNDIAGDYSYPGTPDNQRPVSSVVDTSGVSNPGGGDGGGDGSDVLCESEPATLNPDLAGTYNLSYNEVEAGAPFTDGQAVTATIGGDGSLQIDGKTLTGPRFCVFSGSAHTPEVIWADPDSSIEYALTDNDSGNFNEINVGDASRPRDFGDTQLPTFLGQLLEDEGDGNDPALEAFKALGGDFNPYVVFKGGTAFSDAYALDQQVPFSIDPDTGVVTVDSQYTLDPEETGYSLADRIDNATPRYQIDLTKPDGLEMKFELFVEDGAVIAHKLTLSGTQSGTLEAEERPLPAAITDLFAAFNGDSQPYTLTLVEDDTTYNSGFDNGELCATFEMTTTDGSDRSAPSRTIPFAVWLRSESPFFNYPYDFFRSSARYAADGDDESLTFTAQGIRVIRRADGYIDVESVFIGEVKDRATTDPAAISAAGCADSVASDPEEGNNGKARVSGNGFTGVIDGTEYTYNGNVVQFPNSSGDGTVRFDADDPNDVTTRWRLFVPDEIGTYACNETAEGTVLQHIHVGGAGPASGSGTGDGNCTVKLVQAGPVYEGYFTGSLEQGAGDPLLSVTDGYFFFDPNPSDGSDTLGPNESGMRYTVDGEQFVVKDAFVLSNTPNLDYMTLVSPSSNKTGFWVLPNETGTYTCGQPAGTFRQFHVDFRHKGWPYEAGDQSGAGPAGASCTMTLTQVGDMPASDTDYTGTVEGTFSGTFVDREGSSITVTDGFIRAFGNNLE
ncbi:Metal-dependent hydrolases of the beta-lactamase superfamily I [Salinisphaera sp. PC39]|uniref:hypothetical protein n=1 Tax=Salinisphaera sp. PC39 TaxID=1304156 RepID=UPI0033415A9D